MTDFQALVREFHEASGQPVRDTPEMPPGRSEYHLRIRLIAEEVEEAIEALRWGKLDEIAGELADVLYVVFGTAVSLGVDIGPVFEAVHRANLAKVRNGRIVSANGKIQKPPGWTPADVASALKAQGWEP